MKYEYQNSDDSRTWNVEILIHSSAFTKLKADDFLKIAGVVIIVLCSGVIFVIILVVYF
jgi:hypothetical protein